MPKKEFTDGFVKSVKNDTNKMIDYADTSHKGLHLRVTPNGIKSFVLTYRSTITGKVCNDTMGRYPAVNLALAFRWAIRGLEQNAAGEKVTFIDVAKKNGEPTVSEVLATYNTEYLSNRKSGADIFKRLTSLVEREAWGDLPINGLTKVVIRDALKHVRDVRKAPLSANKLQQMVSTWLKWVAGEDIIAVSPIAGMGYVSEHSVPRKRKLTDEEIRKLWKACQNPGAFGLRQPVADALMLELATAARTSMICELQDHEVFGIKGRDAAERPGAGPVVDYAAERMKMAREFVMPLNSIAVDIISRRDRSTPFVCPTTSRLVRDKGRKPLCRHALALALRNLCSALRFDTPAVPHDLRRTATSLLRRAGYTRDQVDLLIAHSARSAYDPEDRWDHLNLKREMSDKLAAMIKDIVSAKPALTVVESQRAA